MMRTCTKIVAAVVLGLLGLGLASCSSTKEPSPTVTIAPMWKDYIDEALADPKLTDFERQVLSDYQITDAEYQEARDRFKQCMADQGWIVTDMPDGSYMTSGAPGTPNENQAVSLETQSQCSAGTTDWIEMIYFGMKDNPGGLTFAEQVRACFVAHNVPDGANLSDDQFDQMIRDDNFHASTPEGVLCYWDPTGAGGLTVEQAQSMDQNPRVTFTPGP